MDFKTFFLKNIVLSFFISFTLICLTMMVIGLIYEPSKQFGYEIFASPLIFSLISTLPSLINYSKTEPSVNSIIVRKIVHLLTLEALIIGILSISQIITSFELLFSLGLSIMIIDVSVQLIIWISAKRTSVNLTKYIKNYQKSFIEKENAID